MPDFSDSQGHSWHIAFDFPTALAVKDQTGIDLLDLGPDGLQSIANVAILADVLAVICQQQITDQGLTVHQFFARLDGQAFEAAESVLAGAVFDFFPPAKRQRMQEAWRLAQDQQQAALEAFDQALAEMRGN